MVAYNQEPSEPHPAALAAVAWIQRLEPEALTDYAQTLAGLAHGGNRLASATSATLQALLRGEIVDDVDLLGLAWLLLRMEATPGPVLISIPQPTNNPHP